LLRVSFSHASLASVPPASHCASAAIFSHFSLLHDAAARSQITESFPSKADYFEGRHFFSRQHCASSAETSRAISEKSFQPALVEDADSAIALAFRRLP